LGRSRARARGYRAERELVEILWRQGFAVMRAPASGAKIKVADYPDVVAIRAGRVAVFEVKARRSKGVIYVRKEQVRKLREFARRAGGRAYIAVRVPNKGWKFVPVEDLEETSRNYKISRDALERSGSLAAVLADLGFQARLLADER
jgi:Holliday junction resolvase